MNKLDHFKLYVFIILFFVLFVTEFLINQVTHSVLILVDSYYNLFQVCTLIFIILDHKTRSQEKSIRATFGFARFSVLGTLICHTFFAALVFSIIVESLQLIAHTTHEESTLKPHLNLFAAICSVVLQFITCDTIMKLLNRESTTNLAINDSNVHFVVKIKDNSTELEHVAITEQQANQMITNSVKDKEINQADNHGVNKSKQSLNDKNESKNSLQMSSSLKDVDGSKLKELKKNKTSHHHLTLRIFRNFISCTLLIVNSIIGCILSKSKNVDQLTVDNALKILDPLSAILSVALLSLLVAPEIKQSGLILLQSLPSYIDIDILKRKIMKRFPSIIEIHEFHVWSLNTEKIIATCHIKLKHHFKNSEQFTSFFNELQSFFRNEGIDQTTIQPEFVCANALKSDSSNCTLDKDNENLVSLKRSPSCLLKCSNLSGECEKNVCCHSKAECDDKRQE